MKPKESLKYWRRFLNPPTTRLFHLNKDWSLFKDKTKVFIRKYNYAKEVEN